MEELIRVIFDAVKSLEDMVFFVKYMVQVRPHHHHLRRHLCVFLAIGFYGVLLQIMPESPVGITSDGIWGNVLDLQSELTAKREVTFTAAFFVMAFAGYHSLTHSHDLCVLDLCLTAICRPRYPALPQQ